MVISVDRKNHLSLIVLTDSAIVKKMAFQVLFCFLKLFYWQNDCIEEHKLRHFQQDAAIFADVREKTLE